VAKGETRAPELRLSEMARFCEVDPMPLCFGPPTPDFVCKAQDSDFSENANNGAVNANNGASLAVDQMRVNVFYGGALCDAGKVRLSDLVCVEGDTLEWVYDLGTAHRYTLRLIQVLDAGVPRPLPRILTLPRATPWVYWTARATRSPTTAEHRKTCTHLQHLVTPAGRGGVGGEWGTGCCGSGRD
jgi:hypothetical protein